MKRKFSCVILALVLCLCGCSKENHVNTSPSKNELAKEKQITESSESQDTQQSTTEDENILSEMDAATIREMNIFLSNFSETGYKEFPFFSSDAEEKIQFAFLHATINSYSLIFYQDEYMGISATDVDKILKRFFGDTVPHETPKNSEYWMYENGKFIMPAADGESYPNFSIVTGVAKRADGNFDVAFNIYSDPSVVGGDVVTDKTVYSLTESEAASKYEYVGEGQAILKAKVYNGENTYELVSYTIE